MKRRHEREDAAGSDSSRRNSTRRPKYAASANTTSSRMASTGEQVHLHAARARTAAEEKQQRRQAARERERKNHGAAHRRCLEVDLGGGHEERDAQRDTACKDARGHRVADRIAQRAHHREADAAEQEDCGQQHRIVAASAETTEQVRKPECGEEQRDCFGETTSEFVDTAYGEAWFHRDDVGAGQNGNVARIGAAGEADGELHQPAIAADFLR